jgi:hypothetical protein
MGTKSKTTAILALTITVGMALSGCAGAPSLHDTCKEFKGVYSSVLGTALGVKEGTSHASDVITQMDDLIKVTSKSKEKAFTDLTSYAESLKSYAGRDDISLNVNTDGQTDFAQLAPTVYEKVIPLCESKGGWGTDY